MTRLAWLLAVVALAGCRSRSHETCDRGAQSGDLVLNEIVSKNEGVWIDEIGETDDWVEIVNKSERTLNLASYSISDGKNEAQLPARTLAPGGRTIIWLDGSPEQGDGHMPFKVSSSGETLSIFSCETMLDEVDVPELAPNEAFARHPDRSGEFAICRYTTPGEDNGEDCRPPEPYGLVTDIEYAEFEWPASHPALPSPLAISELALLPANFVEVQNTSDEALSLAGYTLELAAIRPGVPFPERGEGFVVDLGDASLAPEEQVAFIIDDTAISAISESPEFEGVATLFGADGEVVDRIDFMHFPEGSSLARSVDSPERPFFCDTLTPGEPNECEILPGRAVGNRVRGLRTTGDFAALAEGGTTLGTSAVKFVVDVDQDRAVHFLSSARWPLHYTFVREVIDGDPSLDRCNPAQNALFYDGWRQFSQEEYFVTTGRHYFLGTLVRHGATDHHTIEHAQGDVILPEDIRDTFFTVTTRVLQPERWAFRPQDDTQVEKSLELDGDLPIVSLSAPFADLTYQPLTHGVGYGILTFVPASELHSTPLGSQVLLVTDDVPNDIPLVGGLITEAFQTPLAHVNVLSQSRGTPNMALRGASEDGRIQEHLGDLVRLTVQGDGFSIEPADPDEAAAFWEGFLPSGPQQAPRLDASKRGLVDLRDASLEDLPRIGAKAAQIAELYRAMPFNTGACAEVLPFRTPEDGFAIPVAHFLRHYEESGAQEFLLEEREKDDFSTDPLHRAEVLEQVRTLIRAHPVEPVLLFELLDELSERFAGQRVRFRSSSNAEDLPGFNGAGLYTSTSIEWGDDSRSIEDGLRLVWASLFNARAWDEREIARVDHDQVAMGVLVHEAFLSEAANGVGVSRNVTDPNRGDIYYVNVQAGEASVTNPAPGVSTEAFTYRWTRPPTKTLLSASNLTFGEPVMTKAEDHEVACALAAIHAHFEPLLNPQAEDPWFAMEIEFKLEYPTRNLVVKQARPHAFGGFEASTDCRAF